MRTSQPITTKHCSYISLVMLVTWWDFGGILLESLFLPNFLWKYRMCLFKVKHSIGHISGMVGPIDVKRKGGASVGYWVNYVILTFDLTRDLDLWIFKVKFQISCISEIVIWLMWNKKSKSIRYWADCMVLPFHTHDLDLVVSRSKFEIALFEADWQRTRKGCESIIHDHDRNVG